MPANDATMNIKKWIKIFPSHLRNNLKIQRNFKTLILFYIRKLKNKQTL